MPVSIPLNNNLRKCSIYFAIIKIRKRIIRLGRYPTIPPTTKYTALVAYLNKSVARPSVVGDK